MTCELLERAQGPGGGEAVAAGLPGGLHLPASCTERKTREHSSDCLPQVVHLPMAAQMWPPHCEQEEFYGKEVIIADREMVEMVRDNTTAGRRKAAVQVERCTSAQAGGRPELPRRAVPFRAAPRLTARRRRPTRS